MQIKTFKGGYDSNFAYLVYEQDQALLIDPSVPATEILNFCKENNLNLQSVVVMHSHHDHILGLREYQK